jgi:putative oxidoreductase
MEILVLLGRVLYSLIFILSGVGHFQGRKMMAGYAKSKGLPAAELMVVASGAVELIGGILILLGYQARYGAWLIVLFLVPVTFTMHRFWTLADPMQKAADRAMFLKNIALLGAALLIAYFGSGPFSLGN